MSARLERDYFEALYAERADPWGFETSPEAAKYAATVAALGGRRYGRAFEAGCSVGVLTGLLAAHCDALEAVDVSAHAVEAARTRLAGAPHVRVERRTLPEELPAGPFDLIVCSEILYYWSRELLVAALPPADADLSTARRRGPRPACRAPRPAGPRAVAHRARVPARPLGRSAVSGRVVIAGGGPAGLATARAYREAGGDGEVVLVGAEPHAPYQRPPLTKGFLRGETGPGELPLESRAWYAERGIELLLGVPATELDPDRRALTLADGRVLAFDACVLATGAEPARLPVPGGGDARLIRRIKDAGRLRERTGEGTRVAVVGSGFIGCEAAASLAMRGAAVTLVTMEPAPQAARLGAEAGERIAGWLRALGVTLVTGAEVEAIEPANGGSRVRVAGNAPIEVDVVACGAGIRPNVEPAEAGGLALEDGRVPVDASLRTAAAGVYAAGDVALAVNAAAGRRLAVGHWGEALNHGAVAGRVLAGADARWRTAPGFWSTIGEHTLKHVAWGDGFDTARLVEHGDGAFTVWYGAGGVLVGVLAHDRDEDYERGRELVEAGARLP